MDYQESMLELQEPLIWDSVSRQITSPTSPNVPYNKLLRRLNTPDINVFTERKVQKDNADLFTACVFGECGSGKSTALTEIAKLFSNERIGAR